MTDLIMPNLVPCVDIKDSQFDGVVVVTDSPDKLTRNLECLRTALEEYKEVDDACSTGKETVFIQTDALPSKRLIFAATGPLNRDYDDVRRFYDAAAVGIKRALKAGCRYPLLVRPTDDSYPNASDVAVLGALHSLYVPLEIREDIPEKNKKVECLGIWGENMDQVKKLIKWVHAVECGRIVTRDIGGSDPERMAAPKVAEYVEHIFQDTSVKVEVISDLPTIASDFPLMAAVDRAASSVTRHAARLIFLEYEGAGPIEKTLFIVGKGVTYDTGGADIKAGGVMAGMHRDKCGAATVAGFFKILSLLKPKGIKVCGGMALARNSVGNESYVADELITSRAGVRVRIGNTDAEGRMVMTDVLCKFKEQALNAVNPELFTIATLTGHAIRAMGPAYSIILDNGPAKKSNTARNIQNTGDLWADPFEVSTVRREDYEFNSGKSEYEDILQCNNAASSATPRGHQIPAAFMIVTSGLDKHGIDSDNPLPYSHLDIAGSSGPFPGIPTASPLVAFSAHFVLPRI